MLLAAVTPAWTQTPGSNVGSNAEVAKLTAQVAALMTRVAQLEARLNGPLTVKQPFIVKDDSGAVLLQVERASETKVNIGKSFRYEEDGESASVEIAAAGGKWVALGASRSTAFLSARAGSRWTRMTADDSKSELRVSDDTKIAQLIAATAGPRLDMTTGASSANLGVGDSSSNVALRISSATGQVVAMGVDSKGAGAVHVYDGKGSTIAGLGANASGGQVAVYATGGKPAAAMAMKDGGGILQIFDSKGEVLGSLFQSQNGGMLQINSLGGEPMVEAGVLGSNKGIVRTGPWMRVGNMMGIPGSFIVGK
jgi:hypothetical protein